MDDLVKTFSTLDADGNGYITVSELKEALELCGFKLPQYKVRDLIREFDTKIQDDKLDMDEFKALYTRLESSRDGRGFKEMVSPKKDVEVIPGKEGVSADSVHVVTNEEQVAFSNWINRNLEGDPDCQRYLPLNPETRDLYTKCSDGIILCKLINQSQAGTIDERAINKGNKLSVYQIHENLTLALNSAQAIGCNIVNIGADDLKEGKPYLVLGLLWQIIRIGLLSDVNLHENPNLAALLEEGETLEEFMRLSPEQILIRWVNYHLRRSPCGRQVANFTTDIKDSVAYIHLLHQIAPKDAGVSTTAEHEHNVKERAELMLQEADKIGCRQFVSPEDVVNGNSKLNLAFVANLYNSYPALDKVDDVDMGSVIPETREEKTYRNWMNSLGVSPFVNNLYSDLTNGLIIFQLFDIIRPKCVDWSRVHNKFNKLKVMMEKIENCNYAVQLGKDSKFSLVGIDGKDLYDGNPTLTLALVWQLMRAYTLVMLSKLASSDGHPMVEKEIVAWVNEKLRNEGKKRQISSFNDPNISDAKVVIDLVDAIKKGSVNYSLVKDGVNEEERLDNAKYAISMARKIGARVYALPEDIVEVKQKMVMTVFACLMIKDYQPEQRNLTN
jgi:plastin-3